MGAPVSEDYLGSYIKYKNILEARVGTEQGVLDLRVEAALAEPFVRAVPFAAASSGCGCKGNGVGDAWRRGTGDLETAAVRGTG